MNCDWTEKISLLIDGELAADDARAAERHLAGCAACSQAREDFLLMRREISAYRVAPDQLAQHQALRRILGAGAAAATSRGESRERSAGWRERASGLFALPRLSPALAGALAAADVALVVVGVVMLRKPERVEVAQATKPATGASATNRGNANAGDARAQNASFKPRRPGANAGGQLAGQSPKIVKRLKLPVTPKLAVDPAELVETQLASLSSQIEPNDLSTARHVEQAQVLLRSFRNSRAGGEPSASDVAYEKRRAGELLFRNIVLRREAESKGNVAVASLLDNLEPILIDISHLPDRPAQDDMRAINERMRRKNIVAMLQVADASHIY
ncbi:MAG: zf-HC2 domain-containing protein [Acidobacteria bacterium]|nr:zf-HC2 domain-containing protein [Acidobacteriota bacterium]